MVRKAISSIFLDFLELKLFCVGAQKKLVYAGNQLLQTFGMGAGWDLLVIQALRACALRQEERIMWCSTNQPMPDSHSVERYLASKEYPTCKVDGMMSSNIETWQDTSDFLRATPCLPCIYALDIDCRWKKFDSIIISMFDTKSGPWPQKSENRLLGGFIRYSSAVWCNMLHTSLDDVGKHQNVERSAFSMCYIMKLRRMKIQDPDDGVLNPTHLAVKPDSNRFNIILDIVLKRWRAAIWRYRAERAPQSQSLQMLCGWNEHRSEPLNQHRKRSGTWGLVHKPSLDPTFQRCLRK